MIVWLTGSYGWLLCPTSQESTIPPITSTLIKIQSTVSAQCYHFHTIVKSNHCKVRKLKSGTGYSPCSLPAVSLGLLCLPVPCDLTSLDCTTWACLSSGFHLQLVEVPAGNQRARGESSPDVYSEGCSLGSGRIPWSVATSPIGWPFSQRWAHWLLVILLLPLSHWAQGR